MAIGFASVLTALAPALHRLARSWPHRVAVEGHSMEPTLRHGDWLLVDPIAYRARHPTRGKLVVARDPRATERQVVKRAVEVLSDGRIRLAGDHPAHAADAERIGPIESTQVIGEPWLRYWPLRRIGRLSASASTAGPPNV